MCRPSYPCLFFCQLNLALFYKECGIRLLKVQLLNLLQNWFFMEFVFCINSLCKKWCVTIFQSVRAPSLENMTESPPSSTFFLASCLKLFILEENDSSNQLNILSEIEALEISLYFSKIDGIECVIHFYIWCNSLLSVISNSTHTRNKIIN